MKTKTQKPKSRPTNGRARVKDVRRSDGWDGVRRYGALSLLDTALTVLRAQVPNGRA